jgi:hypothetical protein
MQGNALKQNKNVVIIIIIIIIITKKKYESGTYCPDLFWELGKCASL